MTKTVTLGEICKKLESGSRPKGGVTDIGDIPSLGGEHINANGGFNFTKLKCVTQSFYEKMTTGKIQQEDILIVKDGATTGKVSIVNNDFPYAEAAINEHVFKVTLRSDQAYSKYIFFYLFSPNGQRDLLSDFRGATIGGISRGILEKVRLSLPSLPEQRRIAALLDRADALRQKDRQLLVHYDKLAQSVFMNILGNPFINEKGWEMSTVGEVCTKVTDGVHAKPNYTNSGVPFVSVKNITSSYLLFEECKFISKEDHKVYFKRCNPERGDVLYTKVGATYGRAAVVETDEEFSLYVSVALLKPRHNIINYHYLRHLMNSFFVKKQADSQIKGIGVPDLHLIEIKSFRIPIPPLLVQTHFARAIEQIEQQKAVVRQQLAASEGLFARLLQESFG